MKLAVRNEESLKGLTKKENRNAFKGRLTFKVIEACKIETRS